MMPLSIDLRKRVLDAYENKESSIPKIAERFKIGTATFVRWSKQKSSLGTIVPGLHPENPVN